MSKHTASDTTAVVQAPLEAKATVGSSAGAWGSVAGIVVLYLLDKVPALAGLPDASKVVVGGALLAMLVKAVALGGAYLAPHTPRPDLVQAAVGDITGQPEYAAPPVGEQVQPVDATPPAGGTAGLDVPTVTGESGPLASTVDGADNPYPGAVPAG